MKPDPNALLGEHLQLITQARPCADEDQARALLESLRWPSGPTCPHCNFNEVYTLTARAGRQRPARRGLYSCAACRNQFTVTVGTIFEDSHLPLSKWLMAISILCLSKKPISSRQLHRMLNITYKTAWFMAQRIRHALQPGLPLGELLNQAEVHD